MRIRKPLVVGSLVCTLFWGSFSERVVEAKQSMSSSSMNRVIINGKVVLDTHYSNIIMDVVKKNMGQTIVILPRSAYSGIWKKQQLLKHVRGKMISVFVNGKRLIDSKVQGTITAAMKKHLGKRIVIKQRDTVYPEYSSPRVNVVLKGPYSKEVLLDYLKQLVVTDYSTRSIHIVKRWMKDGIRYIQYKNGSVVSFSCRKTKDTRVQVIREMKKRDYHLNMDYILITYGKRFFSCGTKRKNGRFTTSIKSEEEVYEVVTKSVEIFSCG